MGQHTDLDELREQFPDWRIGTTWITSASGPDRRSLWAKRDEVTISAWSAASLARAILREERGSR